METIAFAREFFSTNLPPALLEKVDLHTLKLEKHSFVDDVYKASEADVLYSVRIDSELGYLYLLCEHQSEVDKFIAYRLLSYTVRAMEMHLKQHPNTSLPVIYPMVVYTGHKPWDAPLELYALFGQNESLAREYLFKPFHLLDVNRITDDDLSRLQWFGVTAFALKYRRMCDFECFLDRLLPMIYQLELNGGAEGIQLGRIVLKYTLSNIQANDLDLFKRKIMQHLPSTLGDEIMTLEETAIQLGIQKGIQKGMQKGKRSLFIELLESRFGTIPSTELERIESADGETLSLWCKKLITMQKMEEILA